MARHGKAAGRSKVDARLLAQWKAEAKAFSRAVATNRRWTDSIVRALAKAGVDLAAATATVRAQTVKASVAAIRAHRARLRKARAGRRIV